MGHEPNGQGYSKLLYVSKLVHQGVIVHYRETLLGNDELLHILNLPVQVYSSVLVVHHKSKGMKVFINMHEITEGKKKLWSRHDSNMQPSDLESDVLPLHHRIIAVDNVCYLINVVFMLWQWVIASYTVFPWNLAAVRFYFKSPFGAATVQGRLDFEGGVYRDRYVRTYTASIISLVASAHTEIAVDPLPCSEISRTAFIGTS